MRYNGDKSNLQFSSLNGLTDAIQDAVTLILDYEKEHDQKLANTVSGQTVGGNYANSQQENNHKANSLGSDMNRYMGNLQHFNQEDTYQPRPLYNGLKVDQPIYEMQNNIMGNNQNYRPNDEQAYGQNYNNQNFNQNYNNQEDNQIDAYSKGNQPNPQYGSGQQYGGNQMDSQMQMDNGYQSNPYPQSSGYQSGQYPQSNGYQSSQYPQSSGYQSGQHPQGGGQLVLARNQRYIKKLLCKTKKTTRANRHKLNARNYASGSSQYDDYMMFRNGYNSYDYIPFAGFYSNFNELNRPGGYKPLGNDFGAPPQVIRYPVYVSEYDTDLVNRLYSIRNAFI